MKIIVNRFKEAYDNLEIIELKETGCLVDEKKSRVNGYYNVAATFGNETIHFSGNWQVAFEKDDDLGYWYIYSVEIEGISF